MQRIELISKRKEREKHFLNPDGTITAELYNCDIHYLKDNHYEEIDNTLVLKKGEYINKSNDFNVHLKKDSLEYRVDKDSYYLELKIDNKEEKRLKLLNKGKNSSKVKYDKIVNGIDIIYQIISKKLKESIVLNDSKADLENLRFYIDTNLKFKLEKDGKISFYDKEEKIFIINAPYMIDNNGDISYDVKYEIEDNILKVNADKKWLEEAEYPVTIDPTIVIDERNSIEDTYIYPGDTNVNNSTKDILKCGVERVNNNDITNRTLIKFDLPDIGTGSQVVDAKLNLIGYITNPLTYSEELVSVHRITNSWNVSTVRWNNFNNSFDLRTEACFMSERTWLEMDNEIVPQLNEVDLTNLVQHWYTDLPNYGILLKPTNESYKNQFYPAFYSNDSTETFLRPILVISYLNQNGLVNYMKYFEQSYGIGKSYVNTFNGNLTATFNLSDLVGGKISSGLELIYNTNDVILANNYGLGNGYKFNFYQTIKEVTIDNVDYLEYLDVSGNVHYFLDYKKVIEDEGEVIISEDNTFYDEMDPDLIVKVYNNAEHKYVMSDKNGNQSKFKYQNNKYYLVQIEDTEGNYIDIEYQGELISEITDNYDNFIGIIYDPVGIIISGNNNPVIYFTNNKISSINMNEYDDLLITYDNNNLISTITDFSGKKLRFDYHDESPYRVEKVTEVGVNNGNGIYYEFDYRFKSTNITDNNERTTNITFNNYGALSSITNLKSLNSLKNAYGSYQEYGQEYQMKNKMQSNGIYLKYVKNYLNDSSFEDNTMDFTLESGIAAIVSSEEAYSGYKSLKITNSSSNKKIYKNVIVPKGNNYTFSAYLKNTNTINLKLSYTDSNNQLVEEIEVVKPNQEFSREDVTITYPSDAISDLKITVNPEETGIVYMDNMQLEEGNVANEYNYLENSDFSDNFNGWTTKVNDQSSTIGFSVVALADNVKALKIAMQPDKITSLGREFNIPGSNGDCYTISFWYKNEGLSCPVEPYFNHVVVRFDYGEIIYDEITGEPLNPEIPGEIALDEGLNPNENSWQYYTKTFYAFADYASIKINFFQQMQANDLYITNIMLNKDIPSQAYNYNIDSNLESISDYNDSSTLFNYDSNNQLIKMTNPRGKDLTFEYDNEFTNRVIKGVSKTGISNEIEYDAFDNPKVMTITNRGDNSELNQNLYEIRTKGTNKYLRVISNTIKVKNQKHPHDVWLLEKVIVDSKDYYKIKHSIVKKYLFNYFSSIILNSEAALFEFIKNKNGSYLIKIKDSNNYLKHSNNNLVIHELEESDFTYQFYLEKIDYDYFIQNEATYTQDGKFITSTTDTLLNRTLYDVDNYSGLMNSITDTKGIITNYDYNIDNSLSSISRNGKTINYTYNNQKMLSKVSDGNREYNFTYDEFLNRRSVSVNNVNLVTDNYENSNGNLVESIYGNNQSVYYSYDELNRLNKITKLNDIYNLYYDGNGSIAKIISNSSVVKYKYDLAKRLSEYKTDNFKIKYSYDSDNNIINKNYIYDIYQNEVSSIMNDENQIETSIFSSDSYNTNYDKLGRIINRNINNNYDTNYTYVTNGKRTSLIIDSVENNGDKYHYKYDKLNNITHIYYNNELINRYYYDSDNQLIEEKDYIEGRRIKYSYDGIGNILVKRIYNLENNVVLSEDIYEYNDQNWCDKLTKFNNEIITYDSIGNPTTIGNRVLTYTNGRELSTYSDATYNINYKYNLNGIRTSKVANNVETKYYLDERDIIYEKRGNKVIYYIRENDGHLIGFNYENHNYYYLKNGQEDIVGILDENLNKIVSYRYDSWGNILEIIDTSNNNIGGINPFRYKSYYYDVETGLYYLNSRYYNPIWGRFINTDGQLSDNVLENNLYTYCGNNPIVRVDIGGQFWWYVAIAAIGAAVGATSKVISNIASGEKDIGKGVLGAAVGGAIFGVVLAGTGNLFLASFSSAASETFTNEIQSYARKEKEVTKQSIVNSTKNIVKDTIINGIVTTITGHVASKIIPTNPGWFEPKKFVSSFIGKYAVKGHSQTFIQGSMQTGITVFDYLLGSAASSYPKTTINIYTLPLERSY